MTGCGCGSVAVSERVDRFHTRTLASAVPAATDVPSGLNATAFSQFTAPVGLLGFEWYRFPMEAVIDQAGRILLPKAIRDALGLLPGTKVDISPYGAGVQVVPAGRTARLVEENGVLVAAGETPVDDDIVFALIDAGRT